MKKTGINWEEHFFEEENEINPLFVYIIGFLLLSFLVFVIAAALLL
jgi:hypothetical protein